MTSDTRIVASQWKAVRIARDARSPPPNFTLKLVRPGFGPAAELPVVSQARRRHGGCNSPLGAGHVIGGNRRAAPASARGTGRTA